MCIFFGERIGHFHPIFKLFHNSEIKIVKKKKKGRGVMRLGQDAHTREQADELTARWNVESDALGWMTCCFNQKDPERFSNIFSFSILCSNKILQENTKGGRESGKEEGKT